METEKSTEWYMMYMTPEAAYGTANQLQEQLKNPAAPEKNIGFQLPPYRDLIFQKGTRLTTSQGRKIIKLFYKESPGLIPFAGIPEPHCGLCMVGHEHHSLQQRAPNRKCPEYGKYNWYLPGDECPELCSEMPWFRKILNLGVHLGLEYYQDIHKYMSRETLLDNVESAYTTLHNWYCEADDQYPPLSWTVDSDNLPGRKEPGSSPMMEPPGLERNTKQRRAQRHNEEPLVDCGTKRNRCKEKRSPSANWPDKTQGGANTASRPTSAKGATRNTSTTWMGSKKDRRIPVPSHCLLRDSDIYPRSNGRRQLSFHHLE